MAMAYKIDPKSDPMQVPPLSDLAVIFVLARKYTGPQLESTKLPFVVTLLPRDAGRRERNWRNARPLPPTEFRQRRP